MQSERGLQAAETCVMSGASVFPDALFSLTNDEWQYAFELFGAVAASGRFCGLKSALLSPRLHSYGLERVAVGGPKTAATPGCSPGESVALPVHP